MFKQINILYNRILIRFAHLRALHLNEIYNKIQATYEMDEVAGRAARLKICRSRKILLFHTELTQKRAKNVLRSHGAEVPC